MLPTPHPISVPPATKPLLARIAETVRERRLPYQLSKAIDRAACAVGVREKTVSANGMRFRVRRGTMDELFVQNVAEGGEYGAIEPGWTVVDVGGNIGTFTVRAAQTAARVIVAEPSSDNFRLLSRNIAMNGLTNVMALNVAVAGKPGTVTLNCGREGGVFSIVPGRGGDRTETVKAVTLDSLLPDQCDFLKMDCEGAEHEILHGLSADAFRRIDRIAMEWHGAADRDERIRQGCALVDLLLANGFHISEFTEFTRHRGGMIHASRH